MAHMKVSHPLTLVLLLLASGARALPMGPLMGFFGPSLLGPGLGGSKAGKSYSCGASYGSCARGQEEYSMIYVKEPTMLTAVTRTMVDQNTMEGMTAVIQDSQTSQNKKNGQNGLGGFGHGHGATGGYGGMGYGGMGYGGMGYGGMGYGGMGYGGTGGYGMGLGGGYGLMGALGGVGMQEPRLDLDLKVLINKLAIPLDLVLVFTTAIDQDKCTPESLGPVLTSPASSPNMGLGGGYASPMLMMHGGGGAFGGHPGDSMALEREYGVVAQLRVQEGVNSFKIKGMGSFKNLEDLAGRGMALCEDVVMGMDHKPVCTGKTFKVLFCAKLGYGVTAPTIMPMQDDYVHA